MQYSNDKIKQLIIERDLILRKYDREIENEIQKEKAKYKFSWKRFLLIIVVAVSVIIAIKINERIFPKTSIWSWSYYIGD